MWSSTSSVSHGIELAIEVRSEQEAHLFAGRLCLGGHSQAAPLFFARNAARSAGPSSFTSTDAFACFGHRLALHDTESERVIVERSLQELPPAVEAAHHGADGAAHDLRDLLVAELLDVTEDHGDLEVGRERIERALHLALDDRLKRLRLGVAEVAHRRRAHPAVDQRIGVRPLEDGALEPAAAVLVDEGVGEDPEQPRLQVRAGVELVPRPHRLEERVLDEILGLGRVAGQLAGDRVQRVEVPDGLLGEPIDFLLLYGGRGPGARAEDKLIGVQRAFLGKCNTEVKAAIPKI